jgi:glycine betaine/proline transport system substrate-binding protein
MIKRIHVAMTLASGLALSGLLSTPVAAQCGRVTIADMNWDSATFLANLDRTILAHGFGCDAELVTGDTMPTGTSMIERGQPDIAPELWTNSFSEPLRLGVEEGRLSIAGRSLIEGGIEGYWVPSYLLDEYPELATIEGIIANAELFTHPESRNRSALYGCPAGWNCQITARNNFIALGLEEHGFDLIDPGSGAALAGSIARAYERSEPWVGYYWSPTSILGKYSMVMVDFGTGVDEEHYLACTSQEDCLDPRPTMWPSSPVHTVTTAAFAERAPDAHAYLQARAFTNEAMNELLAWMDDNQADGEFAAEYFLIQHPDVWQAWLPAAAAERVRNALGL